MKVTRIGLTVLLCGTVAFTSFAQDRRTSGSTTDGQAQALPEYYIINGAPANVKLDLGRVLVKFAPAAKSERFQASLADAGLDAAEVVELGTDGWAMISTSDASLSGSDLNGRLQQALNSPSVAFASPVMVQEDGLWTSPTEDILVRLRPEYRKAGPASVASAAIATEVVESDFGGIEGAYRLRCDTRNGFEVLALANQLALDPRVEWAEPDMRASVKRDLTPNDPGWGSLWGLNNTGQSGGTVDMDMDCDLAWDVSTGSASVKVLVLDDGAELAHPDLNIGGGADFTGNGTSGGPGNVCDNHGTAVSGCVSALINNSLGTVGAAPGCKVLIAKFTVSNVPCDGSGTFQFSWLVSALNWGQAQGARISSNSNGFSYSSSVATKYQDTYNAGMVHFASAGNDGIESIGFPGSLSMVNAISAINRYGNKASFSSYGAEVSFAAPGQTIYTTDRTGTAGYSSGNYTSVDGTSFSCPYAAGVAALVLSVDPGLTQVEVEDQLKATATDLGAAGFDTYFGYGLLNASNALANPLFDITSDVNLGTAPLTVNFTGSTAREADSWSWDFGDGGTADVQNPTHEFLAPGSYTVSSTITSGGRSYTKTVADMIAIYADTIDVLDGRFEGTTGTVEVSVRNYVPLAEIRLPILYTGTLNIVFDSASVVGLRSSSLTATTVSRVDNQKRASVAIRAGSGPLLAPGDGPVARLWFHRSGSAAGTNTVAISNYTGQSLSFTADAGSYVPVPFNGSIAASCCQGIVGDANGDLQYEPTISDVSMLISHLFVDGIPLDCLLECDINQSGGVAPVDADITISDISALIDYLFVSGTPLSQCF